jgi:hypothetical protein
MFTLEIVTLARLLIDEARERQLRIVTAEETGADHCQHDNPTIGQELAMDWLADVFKVDQQAL